MAKRKKKTRLEFSKIVLGSVIALYFVAAVFSAVLIWDERELLGEWLAFIGAPVAVAIAFYGWKARAENLIKLSRDDADKLNNIN